MFLLDEMWDKSGWLLKQGRPKERPITELFLQPAQVPGRRDARIVVPWKIPDPREAGLQCGNDFRGHSLCTEQIS